MIEDFLHVGITCRDLERSIRFYETLGLSVVSRIGEVEEADLGRVFGLPKGHLAVVHLAPPAATSKLFIDLVQWLEPPPIGESYPMLNHVGINRFALRVSNIDATVTALRERGVRFLSDAPGTIGEGIRSIVTVDPDGVFVQLVEWL